MKKLCFTFVLHFIFTNGILLSQSGWFWQNPLPQGNYLYNVSFPSEQLVYISGAGGTLLKSSDNGNNLTTIQTGLDFDIGVNFINELTGFTTIYGDGFLRTTTGGTSWEYFQIRSGYSTGPIQHISGTLFFALVTSYAGNYKNTFIYKSTDLGNTWFPSFKPDTNTWLNSFHFINLNTGYAVGRKWPITYSKIYKTINGGLSWDSIASNIRAEFKTAYFTNANTGFVTITVQGKKILRTSDGCISWDTVVNSDYDYNFHFFNETTGYAKSTYNILISTNAGINWQLEMTGKNTFLKNLNEGFGIDQYWNHNFLYKTTNRGNNWNKITYGIMNNFWDIEFINTNTGFIAGENSKIYKTTDSGLNWIEYDLGIPQGFNGIESIDFINQNTGYLGIDNGRFAKTTDCGDTWNWHQTEIYEHFYCISFPSKDTGYAITKMGSHLKTTNGGINWSSFGHIGGPYGSRCVFVNNTTGFTANQEGFINITTNGGLNWRNYIADSVYWFWDACAINETTWFTAGYNSNSIGNKGNIYRTTDMGANWSKITFPYEIGSINFANHQTGYASTYNCLMYKTTNGGNSWFPTKCINGGISFGIYFTDEQTGYAVGQSGQIIKTTTGGGELIGIQPVTNEIPQSFMLYQNYPNPFNPNTVIGFQLSAISFTKLIIYDILGREAAVLVNEQLTPGTYEVAWNASNFSSGVYFYRLEAEKFSITKKMVLLK